MKDLLEKLAAEGGCIVSSADCSEIEIIDARARGDWWVDEHDLGYVRRLPAWLQAHDAGARKHPTVTQSPESTFQGLLFGEMVRGFQAIRGTQQQIEMALLEDVWDEFVDHIKDPEGYYWVARLHRSAVPEEWITWHRFHQDDDRGGWAWKQEDV